MSELIELVLDEMIPQEAAAERAKTKYGVSNEEFMEMLDVAREKEEKEES